MPNLNLFTIFLTGLTTGGITCLAIQGGLLLSIIAQQEAKLAKTNRFIPIASFLTGKLLIHTLFGFLLGALGQSLTLSPVTRGWIQIAIGIYLIGIAGNLLNLHPIFRYFVITPPKFLAKIVRNKSKSTSIFAPFILGLTTVFIPCAVTQATEVLAIGSGNPLYGAAIMFSFILGTSPTFALFGVLLSTGAKTIQKIFTKISIAIIVIMSIYTINNGVSLTGSIYTLQNFYQVAINPENVNAMASEKVTIKDGVQYPVITVTNNGYSPTRITLKKDVPVRLKLVTVNTNSCSRAFMIPGLNLEKLLPQTGEVYLDFTPKKLGPLTYTCSMGMYNGVFNVVK